MREERFPRPLNPLHGWEISWDRQSLRGSEESAAAGLQQAGQRETSTDGPGHLAALPSPRHVPAAQQLGTETPASANRPRDRTGVGCAETTQRAWSVVQAAGGGVCWTEPRCTTGAPLSMHAGRGGAWSSHSSLILRVLMGGHGSTSTSSGSTQAQAGCPHAKAALKSEPTPAVAQLQRIYATRRFVSAVPAGRASI